MLLGPHGELLGPLGALLGSLGGLLEVSWEALGSILEAFSSDLVVILELGKPL